MKPVADDTVSSGPAAPGYTCADLDDRWMSGSRGSGGHLVPAPAKLPDGITGTAVYVHGKGLKLGIYESAGTRTCAGYPGSPGHEQTGADSFASWGVGLFEYDNCSGDGSTAGTAVELWTCDGGATPRWRLG